MVAGEEGWGAGYGAEFRQAMLAQSASMSALLATAFGQGASPSTPSTPPDPPAAPRTPAAGAGHGGETISPPPSSERRQQSVGWRWWLTAEGFGYAVGIVRLNGQAVQVCGGT